MEAQEDYKELLRLLNVEYIIVGDYALARHGAPRATGDLDVFVRMSEVAPLARVTDKARHGVPEMSVMTPAALPDMTPQQRACE